jgi:hypothetical protein
MIMIKTQEKSKEHEAKWGGYNDFPSGWTKITIKELVQNTQFDHYEIEDNEAWRKRWKTGS